MKVTINYKYSSRNIFRAEMSDIKINDFWQWLNKNIPSTEARKLKEIVDCDYKRLMLNKYAK